MASKFEVKFAQGHDITPAVVQAALENPGGWVYKIEGTFGVDEAVPSEAIVGAWKVDSSGELTGEFQSNPRYRPNARQMHKFKAMICVKRSDQPAKQVSILASDLRDAQRLLDEEYGAENVFDLRDEKDADRPR